MPMEFTLITHAAAILLLLAGCGPAPAARTQMPDEFLIRTSFASLQRSLAKGDSDGILRQTSPGTLGLFKMARDFGIDPDAMDAEKLSQLEVLLGFQGRWLLGAEALTTRSAADLFEWGMKNGIVQIGGLALVGLHEVKSDGNVATAHMEAGGTVLTNAVLSFSRYGRKWRLDFDKILLAAEPQLAVMRSERRMSKPETAVLMLEGMYRQPIPALRELLLAPKLRQQIATLKQASPSQVYEAVIGELSAGRQGEAEAVLNVFVGIHTNDQRLAFAQAVCTRSRFNTQQADGQFRRVFAMDPRTVEGNCARYVLDLDDHNHVDDNFKGLHLLAADNPDNPLFHWMIGIQCRDYYRHTNRKDRSPAGAQAYQRVLELFDVGPVLVHQTYANILSEELEQNEEALAHRRIAVRLDPKAWSYDGLANTLTAMKMYDEANQTYAKSTELDPNYARYWLNWAGSLYSQGRYEDCISKAKIALAVDPGYYLARYFWGLALEAQAKRKKALVQYEEAIRLNPAFPIAYGAAARVLGILGDPNRAQELLDKKSRIDGSGQPARDEEDPADQAAEDPAGKLTDPRP